jgi:short subunit dehydrogenase-like uncharacterized protein
MDGYGKTAVIAVEAARRLAVSGARAGVLTPSQVFDPESFLGFLPGHGVRWRSPKAEPGRQPAPTVEVTSRLTS